MDGNTYSALLNILGLSHAQVAKELGVGRGASLSWRSNINPIPLTVERALREILYRRLAGDVVTREVDRIMAEAAANAREMPPLKRQPKAKKASGLDAMKAELADKVTKLPVRPKKAKATDTGAAKANQRAAGADTNAGNADAAGQETREANRKARAEALLAKIDAERSGG